MAVAAAMREGEATNTLEQKQRNDALKQTECAETRGSTTSRPSARAKRRQRSSRGRSSLSPATSALASAARLRAARQLSRDTSLAYLLPALTVAHLQLPFWERRCAGFAAAAFFALIHHAYELERGRMQPLLNRIDIFFAVSAAAIEVTAVPPTPLRAVGAAVASGSWLYQKLRFVSGTPEQVYAHIGWHLVSSAVAAALMVVGL